jgi:hypothetical protein
VLSLTSLTPGQHSLIARYAGDASNGAATSVAVLEQVQQLTTLSLASSLNPAATLSGIAFTAVASNGNPQAAPTGVVTFTEGAVVLGTVALDANGIAVVRVASMSAGNHVVHASYAGDGGDFPSVAQPLTQGIQLRATTNALTASATSLDGGQQETLISVLRWDGPVAPTGTMTFTTGSNVIGSATVDKTGVATMTIVLKSTENIVATYSGDSVYSASTSPITSISGAPASQFTMQTNPSSITLQSKQHATVDLTIGSVKGFTDTLSLGCLGLPYAATCTFSTDTATLKSDGTVTVHIVVDTGSPLTAGGAAQTAQARRGPHTAELCLLPGGALLAFLLLRPGSRRPLKGLLLMICIAALALQTTGCGTLDVNGTPAGTYVVKISASGVQTGVTLTQDLALTVTK